MKPVMYSNPHHVQTKSQMISNICVVEASNKRYPNGITSKKMKALLSENGIESTIPEIEEEVKHERNLTFYKDNIIPTVWIDFPDYHLGIKK